MWAIRAASRFLRLSRTERAVLVQAWVLFVVAEFALRCLPFGRLSRLGRAPAANADDRTRAVTPAVARLVWLVEVASRYTVVDPTCLKKALVLSWLLGRRGIATTLRIGVARRDGRLAAHAWLECAGEVILGFPGGEGYERFLAVDRLGLT